MALSNFWLAWLKIQNGRQGRRGRWPLIWMMFAAVSVIQSPFSLLRLEQFMAALASAHILCTWKQIFCLLISDFGHGKHETARLARLAAFLFIDLFTVVGTVRPLKSTSPPLHQHTPTPPQSLWNVCVLWSGCIFSPHLQPISPRGSAPAMNHGKTSKHLLRCDWAHEDICSAYIGFSIPRERGDSKTSVCFLGAPVPAEWSCHLISFYSSCFEPSKARTLFFILCGH